MALYTQILFVAVCLYAVECTYPMRGMGMGNMGMGNMGMGNMGMGNMGMGNMGMGNMGMGNMGYDMMDMDWDPMMMGMGYGMMGYKDKDEGGKPGSSTPATTPAHRDEAPVIARSRRHAQMMRS
ncbi:hypothetical protein O0L34_g14198 [Tuta absoluta]|nr:hypothetical protein O0L34_g14198 [Tuta absoluta]